MPPLVDPSSVFSDLLALGRIPLRVRGTTPEKLWERNLADRMIRCLHAGMFSPDQLTAIEALQAPNPKVNQSELVERLMSEIRTLGRSPRLSFAQDTSSSPSQLKVAISSRFGRKKALLSPELLRAFNSWISLLVHRASAMGTCRVEDGLSKAFVGKGVADDVSTQKKAHKAGSSKKTMKRRQTKKSHLSRA